MAFKREEIESLMEREGVQDFILPRTWEDIPGTEIGLYELANDRWGVIFQIFPPFYAMSATEKKLETMFSVNLPEKSSLQFFAFASKNLSRYQDAYKVVHTAKDYKLSNKQVIKELRENKIKWIEKHSKESLFKSKGLDVRLRNYINLCVATIPRYKKSGDPYDKNEVVNIFSRLYTTLGDFGPKKFTQKDYVSLVREILVPDSDLTDRDYQQDNRTFINTQVVDNNSVMTINEDNTLGLGKMISKKEYEKIIGEQIDAEEEEEEEDSGIHLFSFFSNMFKKKKKKKETEDEERTVFTKWHAKALTTKLYPETISLFKMINNFVNLYGTGIETEIPSPFFCSLNIFIDNKEKKRKSVLETTQWNLWQTESLGDSVRFFPQIEKRGFEAEAINKVLSEGDIPMSAMWSLVIMDDNITNVTKYTERIQKRFLEKTNWVLQEEVVIPHWVFFFSLPLQFDEPLLMRHSKRMNTLFGRNCAAITPLMTGEKGFGAPVLTYVDRAGQLAGVDIFAGETNFNFTVVGTSGSGKSYIMADFFANYLMAGAKIRVIDVGRSYKHLVDLLGGQYIEFTEDSNICLNFFTHVETDRKGRIMEDEIQTIIPLIGLMAMQNIDPDKADMSVAVLSGYISQAVQMAFDAQNKNAGMQDVLEAIERMAANYKQEKGETNMLLENLATALYAFGHPQGEYYKYFNGTNNLKFHSDFVVLELEELETSKHLKSVVLAAISHMISTEFFLGSREQKKILAIDEAWTILENEIVVKFLEAMARRIRKYNGASGIITQSIGDFNKNSSTRAIFDSSATKIFLKQDSESIAAAQNRGELNLDEGIVNLLSTITSKAPLYSEAMFKTSSGFFIVRLITDRVSHWIYTGHDRDMKVIREIQEQYGISELDARLVKGYSDAEEKSIAEVLSERIKKGLLMANISEEDQTQDALRRIKKA